MQALALEFGTLNKCLMTCESAAPQVLGAAALGVMAPLRRFWILKDVCGVRAGTSMAAPQVAGAAALLLAAYAAGGANVTGRGLELKALLLATVQPVAGMARKVSIFGVQGSL